MMAARETENSLLDVGRIFWRAFFSKTAAGCAKGCGGACGQIDVEALQRTIERRAPMK